MRWKSSFVSLLLGIEHDDDDEGGRFKTVLGAVPSTCSMLRPPCCHKLGIGRDKGLLAKVATHHISVARKSATSYGC
jgi:hypothetical protein